jgi:hypothetical protein
VLLLGSISGYLLVDLFYAAATQIQLTPLKQ